MSLQDRLQDDLKAALRQRDALRLSVIRYARSAIHYEEIERQTTLDDDGVIRVLAKQAQQRRESIEAFAKGKRPDLVEKEKAELAIILGYLPQQMSRAEVTRLVEQAIQEVGATGPRDMGKVMGRVMPQVRGRVEGSEVSAIASELLRGLAG